MFFSFARSRSIASLLLLLASSAFSRDESLFTSSVTYCDPPDSLFIQQFDVAYIAKNNSISFNVSASSVSPNLNVTANLMVNVYGMHPVNVSIDLCNIFGGALCPLPMYNFTGSDSITLPSSLGISNRLPGIAFKIPDLEAFVQLSLIEVKTGKLKACVQATLSNGWSTHQPAVEWATGGLAIFALLSASWQSLSPEALAPFRLVELLYLFQTIAVTAFLSLNYPSVYRAYALNFAWAMGLFSTSASSSLQNSINRARYLTGGDLANATAGSAVGFVNRKLSPYNAGSTSNIVIPQSLLSITHPSVNLVTPPPLNATTLVSYPHIQQLSNEVQTVTSASSNVLQAGLPIYVNSIHIATANAFITVFFVVLILMAIFFTMFGIGFAVLYMLSRRGNTKAMELERQFWSFSRAWSLRLALIAFTPVAVFTFYQWTLKDSWLSVALSVILLLFIVGLILYSTILTMRLAIRVSPDSLYSNKKYLASHGPLYAQYRTRRYYFFLPLVVASLLKALIVAFAHENGTVQVALMVVVEALVVVSHVVLRPYRSRGSDVFSTFLAIVRLVCTGLTIAFIESLDVAAIPRVAIGIVAAVIFSISIIVMFINLVMHTGVTQIWRRKSTETSVEEANSDSLLEKGKDTSKETPAGSETAFS